MKKYELTEETKEILGVVLHRIRALRDFGDVKAGDLGGWIEGEYNLNHGGNAWAGDNARVDGNAWVSDDATVSGDAWVSGDSWVGDNAIVGDNALVNGNAEVGGNSMVGGNAWVSGDALLTNTNDYLYIYSIGSLDDSVTFYRLKDGGVGVSCGCFTGTLNDFIEAVAEEHGDNQHGKEYMAAVELAKVRFGVD